MKNEKQIREVLKHNEEGGASSYECGIIEALEWVLGKIEWPPGEFNEWEKQQPGYLAERVCKDCGRAVMAPRRLKKDCVKCVECGCK